MIINTNVYCWLVLIKSLFGEDRASGIPSEEGVDMSLLSVFVHGLADLPGFS